MGGRKKCNDSERNESMEEQLQVRKQYLCHRHGTVSPVRAMSHDNARIHARTRRLGFLDG